MIVDLTKSDLRHQIVGVFAGQPVPAFTNPDALITELDQLRDAEQNYVERITALESELAHAMAAASANHERAQMAERYHQADIDTIGEALLEAAEENSLCEKFDRFIDDVNQDIRKPLPSRKREYEVTYTVTLQVEATSEDRANDLAAQEMRDIDNRSDLYMSYDHSQTERA